MRACSVAAPPYAALGLLSGGANRPLRDKIRDVSSKMPSYQTAVAHRFILAANAANSAAMAKEQESNCDLVVLNVTDTPFRCGLKYVIWFAHAYRAFPHARFIGAGDDDAYVQIDHFHADLANVAAQVGEGTLALWGMIQWRSHYDNVTHDTSTGFMGWGVVDAQAASVRRRMMACEAELIKRPRLRRRAALALGGTPAAANGEAAGGGTSAITASDVSSAASAASADSSDAEASAAAAAASATTARGGKLHSGKLNAKSGPRALALQRALVDAPACAALSANEKRLTAVLRSQVDWALPPFPLANGPLFAICT